ncbi:hypothetical protein KCP75_22745 [Salmonella enterica subsp. enterica]|nr:hypothetical protein KCP75_22745 [Salmonella enterica subsp. enterica]
MYAYDGVCYNAKEAQDLLAKTSDRIRLRRSMVRTAMRASTLRFVRSLRVRAASEEATITVRRSDHPLHAQTTECAFLKLPTFTSGRIGAVNFSLQPGHIYDILTTSPLYAIYAHQRCAYR